MTQEQILAELYPAFAYPCIAREVQQKPVSQGPTDDKADVVTQDGATRSCSDYNPEGQGMGCRRYRGGDEYRFAGNGNSDAFQRDDPPDCLISIGRYQMRQFSLGEK